MINRLRTLKNSHILDFGKISLLTIFLTIFNFSQSLPTPTTNPKPTPKILHPQNPSITPPPVTTSIGPMNNNLNFKIENWNKRVKNELDTPSEKSIQADDNVNIDLCVSEGNIRINGWSRNEVRVFVNEGSKTGFKALNKNGEGLPTRLIILGYDPQVDKGNNLDRCLFGELIEIDVPFGAKINKLEGRDTKISIKSVAKVVVENNEGDITLSEIKEGISARTYEGEIMVENSSGIISLNNSEGNIFAVNTHSNDVGDALTAKTNGGSIFLQSVNNAVLNLRSISGMIRYTGDLQTDGQYKFFNTAGVILLEIPDETSCLFEILSVKSKFQHSDLKFTTYNISKMSETIQKVNAQMGKGDAAVYLQNENGKILIVKRN